MIQWIKDNLVLAVVLAIVIGTVSFVGGIKLADQPFFCGLLCHEMQVHVDSLEANFHGKQDVICMDCHSKPGFINHAIEHIIASKLVVPHFTKIYLKDEHGLHKNVPEFNAEEMSFKDKVGTPEEEELFKKCFKCHPNRLDRSYFMKAVPHMEEVVTDNCKRCHEKIANSKAESPEEGKKVLADFSVPRKIANIHPLHLAKDILCVKCHNRVVHSNNPAVHIPGMDMCFRCHNEGGKAPQVDCKTCHLAQANLFAGINGKGVDNTPSIMLDQAECTDCHADNMKFDINTCVDCHGGDEAYKDTLKEFKDNYKTKYDNVKKLYDEVTKLAEEATDSGKSLGNAEESLKRAEYNFEYAGNDGSRGMHNPDFTDALLSKTEEDLNEVKNSLAK